MVAEGIETALSMLCGLLDAPVGSVWAALSAPGMQALHLPAEPGELLIAADCDDAGLAAAESLAAKAKAAGWAAFIATPPPGADFNDILRGQRA